jgi:hypothetical protein
MTIEEEAKHGSLHGSSMYLFTDNTTVKGALFQGNTPSRKLFNLVVRFRKVQMLCDAEIIVSHVAGTRMIAQGADGVSRGVLTEGVTTGLDMLSFIPLHLNAPERKLELILWIQSRLGEDTEFLSPEQWFTSGHYHNGGYRDTRGFWRVNSTPGKFVWSPAPAAADVAIEELRKSLI